MAMPDQPDDLELSRDALKIVTATQIHITCRLCWWSIEGTYPGAHTAYNIHMKTHPEANGGEA